MRRFLVLIVLIGIQQVSVALTPKDYYSDFTKRQDSLVALSDSIIKGSTLEVRLRTNEKLIPILERALAQDSSFYFAFNGLQLVSRCVSPDNTFRIFSWVVNSPDMNEYRYFGYIQVNSRKNASSSIFKLTDMSDKTENPEKARLTPDSWYGTVYYRVVINRKGRKNVYTLFGWKGKDKQTTGKVIDALLFNGSKPSFSCGMFPSVHKNVPGKNLNRVIFEYSSEAVMTVKYDERVGKIIFDHLAPASPGSSGIKSTYGPDFSYDALQYKKGKWIFLTDIEARNQNSKNNQGKKPKEAPIYQPVKKKE